MKKIWYYIFIILLVLHTSQCLTQCKQQPITDNVNQVLCWDTDPQSLDLNGLEINPNNRFIAYVPSQKTSYFLNPTDGNVWKFEQGINEEGVFQLMCKKNVAINSGFSHQESCIFVAGSDSEQHLFLMEFNQNSNSFSLYRLGDNAWDKLYDNVNINAYFPNTTKESLLVVASGVNLVGNLRHGCIFLQVKDNATNTINIGCLLFNPENSALKPVLLSQKIFSIDPGDHLLTMFDVTPGKILVGKGKTSKNEHHFTLLRIQDDNSLEPAWVNSLIINSFTTGAMTMVNTLSNLKRPVLQSFWLKLKDDYTHSEPMITTCLDQKREILSLDLTTYYQFQSVEQTTNQANSNNNEDLDFINDSGFIIPFEDEIFFISDNKDQEDTNKNLVYRGQLIRRPESTISKK